MVKERRKPVTKEITIKLTDEKIVAMARKVGELSTEKALEQAELARVKSAFKGRIEEKDSEIAKLLEGINEGRITEKLEVVEVFDFEAGQVEVEHDGQVIDVRNMTGEERQMSIKLAPPDQGELPLDGPAPDNVRQLTPAQSGEPEPFVTELPLPEQCPAGEVFITGENDRATIVKYLAIKWKLEIGESAMFKLIDTEVFGNAVRTWEKSQALPLGEPPAQEQQPTTETTQQ